MKKIQSNKQNKTTTKGSWQQLKQRKIKQGKETKKRKRKKIKLNWTQHINMQQCRIPSQGCENKRPFTINNIVPQGHDFLKGSILSLSPFRTFYRLQWQISLPYHILKLEKSVPFLNKVSLLGGASQYRPL